MEKEQELAGRGVLCGDVFTYFSLFFYSLLEYMELYRLIQVEN